MNELTETDLDRHIDDARKLLAERYYYDFVRQAWDTIESQPLIDNWHVQGTCEHLQAVTEGQIKKLLINIPPGCSKSLLTCTLWQAWEWIRNPWTRWFYASYDSKLSTRDSVKCRTLVKSQWYKERWGDAFHLTNDQNQKTYFENNHGGYRLATSVGGHGTGQHPDRICFPPGTMIDTDHGYLPIEMVYLAKYPMRALSRNMREGSLEYKRVTDKFVNHVDYTLIVLETEHQRIECTPNHPIWVENKGWIAASVIKTGDNLMRASLCRDKVGMTKVKSVNVAIENSSLTVYNIEVAENHNYFANGILVHNCIDDPHNVAGAESDKERQATIDWWDLTMSTRGVSRDVSRVIIMQRLHQGDLSGHILEQGGWEHICLPMRYESDRMKTTVLGWEDPRTVEGELLTPEQFSDEAVTEVEASLGPYGTAGQFQQRPSPRDGGMFKMDWFEIVPAAPARFESIVRWWDKAGTEGAGDYTCGVLMGLKEGIYYVLDVTLGQWGSGRRDDMIDLQASIDESNYGTRVKIGMEQEPGSGGKQSAEISVRRLAGYSVMTERSTGTKEDRADAFASQCFAGNVKIVKDTEGNRWNKHYLEELAVFPNGQHDDQVDGSSGAFNKLAKPRKRLLVGTG